MSTHPQDVVWPCAGGAGRIRHIATPTLWLQRLVGAGVISVVKQEGAQNPADLGTKHFDITTMSRHMRTCGFNFLKGPSARALKAELQGLRPDASDEVSVLGHMD